MKKINLFLLASLFIVSANAQSDKYAAAMKKNLAMFDSVKTTADYQGLAAAFERIGDAEKTQWLPYYYAGLALATVGWQDTKLDKDANSEKIKALCDRAEAIEKSSEICEIRNMAATQQMMVDPQSRWASYGQEAGAALQKGMQLNPNNPRLYYLQGMSVFNTPEAFGGGKTKAKPIFEKAVALFKAEQPAPLHPRWGQKQAEEMLAQCQ
ncbi:MAG TPA: hypothetical protein VGQ09_21870 [Chitinophagaceae bacterium]|jgi:hypothetical protein|nr:hypothetical protein [Chitinophagaceae bacterium]